MFRAALHMVINDFFHLRLGASVGGDQQHSYSLKVLIVFVALGLPFPQVQLCVCVCVLGGVKENNKQNKKV